MDPGLLHPLGGQVRVHPRWEAEVAPHRALGRAERPGPVDGGQRSGVGLGQPDAHRGPEQPGEHVAVHERAEVAEHGLNLDLRVPGEDRPEERLVVLAGLGYLHG